MAEYIEREAILKHTTSVEVGAFSEWDVVKVEHIKNAPAADVVEVKHGKWIKKNDCAFPVCSECHTWTDELQGTAEFNYCPNCGAKMDGRRSEE